jgi:hypothetical protein
MKQQQGKHLIFTCGGTKRSPRGSGRMDRMAAWCFAFILSLGCTIARPDVFHIDSVRMDAPKIQNDSLIYTLDIHFHEIPGLFWSYYDQDHNMIVVEFLDAQIISPPVGFPKGMPFLWFKVKTAVSEMALTKAVSRITVGIDSGPNGDQFWNTNVRLYGNYTVRIVIWKEKAAPVKPKKGKFRVIAISVGASLVALVAVIAAITFQK